MVNGKVIMAYFASWSIYERDYHVYDMDGSHLTHINYAFANIRDGLVELGDAYADVGKIYEERGDSWYDPPDMLHGSLHQLFMMKARWRHLKTGLSIGGWTWSSQFSVIARSEEGRKRFVTSAIDALETYGFDYIDLDWEFPVEGGLPENIRSPDDAENFVLLLQEFDTQIKARNYPIETRPFITIAAACSKVAYRHYLFAEMAKYLRFINMMCYDFAGPWSPVAEHQANIYPRDSKQGHSVDEAVKDFLAGGVGPEQIVLGLPFYGREFARCDGFLRPFNGTGDGSWEPGIIDYKYLPQPGYTSRWELSTNSTFLHNPTTRSIISYDDHRVTAFKMAYVQRMNLGGVMFWEMSGDKPLDDGTSLLKTINDWTGKDRDMSINRLCYPKSKYRNIRNNKLCPSPAGKDVADSLFGPLPSSNKTAEAIQYCFGLFTADKESAIPSKPGVRAHAIPETISKLQKCLEEALGLHVRAK